MKFIFLFFLALVVCSCSKLAHHEVAETVSFVPPDSMGLFQLEEVFNNPEDGLWYIKTDSNPVSGIVRQSFPDGTTAMDFFAYNGKKEGTQHTYFPDSRVRFEENYSNNKLHGEVKRWSQQFGYILIAHLQYDRGRLQGEQKKWYPTGELHKILQLHQGRENGLQRAYRKNGVLYANYEARNGRSFGMKRSNLCYQLDDEKIVYNQ